MGIAESLFGEGEEPEDGPMMLGEDQFGEFAGFLRQIQEAQEVSKRQQAMYATMICVYTEIARMDDRPAAYDNILHFVERCIIYIGACFEGMPYEALEAMEEGELVTRGIESRGITVQNHEIHTEPQALRSLAWLMKGLDK